MSNCRTRPDLPFNRADCAGREHQEPFAFEDQLPATQNLSNSSSTRPPLSVF